jgi:hypothetical protein
LFGPIILIGLGILFLLNNFKLITWDIWPLLFQFWPILLVAAGLDVLTGRRSVFSGVMAVLFTVLILALITVGVRLATIPLNWNLSQIAIDEPLGDADQARIDIGFDAGALKLGAEPARSEALVQGKLSVTQRRDPQPRLETTEQNAYFQLNSTELQLTPILKHWESGDAWQLDLTRRIPLTVRINAGLGFNQLDLSQLKLTSLDYQTIYGQTEIRLPSQGRVTADIRQSAGALTIEIPAGVAARIQASSRFGALQIDGDYEAIQGVYQSPGFATARNRVDLKVNGDFSDIHIVQVD